MVHVLSLVLKQVELPGTKCYGDWEDDWPKILYSGQSRALTLQLATPPATKPYPPRAHKTSLTVCQIVAE